MDNENKIKIVENLGDLYELSSNIETWYNEKKVLETIESVAETLNLTEEFNNYLDNQEKLQVTDRIKNSEGKAIPKIKSIETDLWAKRPGCKYLLDKVRNKTYEEVYKDVVELLKEQNLWDDLDYFHLRDLIVKKEEDFPDWRFVKCYAVVGGSEGHYVHVEVEPLAGDTKCVFLGKTFAGIDYALKVSNILTKAFYSN
jgi:hypothetical protein